MHGFLREAGMFAARSGPAVPLGEADGAEPAEEYTPPHAEPAVPHREAGVVPGRVRATIGRGSQEGDTGKLTLQTFSVTDLPSTFCWNKTYRNQAIWLRIVNVTILAIHMTDFA